MNEIFFSDKETIYYNWITVESYILFPDDEVKRENAFHYLYYRFIMEHREYDTFDVGDIDYEEVAKFMTNIISNLNFLEELRLRFISINAAGITTRLLFSLIYHNFKEPSINKAKFLYEASFQEKKKEKKDNNQKPPKIVSESNCHKCLKYHRNVLHYCAAFRIVRPCKALTEDAFINDVKKFFSIAEGFKPICLGHDPSRRNEYAPPFIFEENFLHIKPNFETTPATFDQMEPYSLERMEGYMDKHSRFTKNKPNKSKT